MSFEFDDLKAGGQLRVGSGAICPPIKEGDHKINGSMHAEGPVVFGEPGAEAKNRATLIVNRKTCFSHLIYTNQGQYYPLQCLVLNVTQPRFRRKSQGKKFSHQIIVDFQIHL